MIFARLDTIAQAFLATIIPFALSGFAAVVIGIGLATRYPEEELRSAVPGTTTKLGQCLVLAHWLPTFFIPTLFVKAILERTEGIWGADVRQSLVLLAAFGWLFHCGVSWLILCRAFNWKSRLDRLRSVAFNLQLTGRADFRVIVALGWVVLGPPVVLTYVIILLFQESMVSAPYFMARKTALAAAITEIQSAQTSPDGELQAVSLSAAIVVVVALALLAAHGVGILSRFLAREFMLRSLRRASPSPLRRATPESGKISELLVTGTLVTSAFVHVIAATLALWPAVPSIAAVLIRQPAERGEVFRMLGTLWGPSLRAGLGALLLLMFWAVWCRARGKRLARGAELVALLPPAILGTLGMSLVFSRLSALVVGYTLLCLYTLAVLVLLAGKQTIESDSELLANTSLVGLPIARRLLNYSVSSIGAVLIPFVIALNMVWIEDGVQTEILQSATSVAHHVRGFKTSDLLPGTYVGAVLTVLVWVALASVSARLGRWRFRCAARQLRRWFSVLLLCAAMFSAMAVSIAEASGGTATNSPRDCLGCCVLSELVVTSGEVPPLPPAGKCPRLQIGKIVLRYDGTAVARLEGAYQEIAFREVEFASRHSAFVLTGSHQAKIERLKIEGLRKQNESYDTTPSLVIDGLIISELRVQGSVSAESRALPVVDLTIRNIRGARSLLLRDLRANEIVIKESNFSGTLDALNIDTPQLSLIGDGVAAKSSSVQVTLELYVPPVARSIQVPKVRLQDIKVPSLRLLVRGEAGGGDQVRLELADLRIEGEGDSRIETKNIDTELDISSVSMAGYVTIEARRLRIQLSEIRASHASLRLKADSISRAVLYAVDLEDLELCDDGTSLQNKEISFRNVTIRNRIDVSRPFLEHSDLDRTTAAQRRGFYLLLQEKGIFCGSSEPVGLLGLYQWKLSDLASRSPLLAFCIDQLSGLGIDVWKPLRLAAVLLVCQALIYVLLALISSSHDTSGRSGLRVFGRRLLDSLGGAPDSTPLGLSGTILHALRRIIALLLFVQLTVCSLYFSQTTLH